MPKDPSFGDLSNSVAFKVASRRKQPPQRIAEELASVFLACAKEAGLARWLDRAEAKAGFVNIFFSQAALLAELRRILRQRHRYGTRPSGSAPSINIEFVSANPTGPLSVAHGRQAVVGDVLVRLLRSQGYRVTAEYYLNDEGRQIEMLGRSLRARYAELVGQPEPFPEDGYHGAYVSDVAKLCLERYGKRLLEEPESRALSTFMEAGQAHLLEEIRQDLTRVGRMALPTVNPSACPGRPQCPVVKLVGLSAPGEIGNRWWSALGRRLHGRRWDQQGHAPDHQQRPL